MLGRAIVKHGFTQDVGAGYCPSVMPGMDGIFKSYRLDDVNLIVTRQKRFFRKFLAATYVAKVLNLTRKRDRVSLFQAVLYGNSS